MKVEVTLITIGCATCGVVFAMPEILNETLIQTGNTFYCPNGHSLTHGESDNEKLKRRIKNQADSLSNQYNRIEGLEKSVSNRNGQITKLKKKLKE